LFTVYLALPFHGLDRAIRYQRHDNAMNVPSDGVLLVKNLRFLDLNLLPDWPNVTAETFRASRNAPVAQKDRLRCAEFVLFRLFERWDNAIAKFV